MIKGIRNMFFEIVDKIVLSLIKLFERITKINVKEQSLNTLLQFIRFGIVGLSNSIINYLVYFISLRLLRKSKILVSYEFYIAQILAFLISVLWAFCWNKLYVFKEKKETGKTVLSELLRSYLSYGFTGLILSEILLYVWVDKIGISEYVAPIINMIICLPVNFILNKFWTFHKMNN